MEGSFQSDGSSTDMQWGFAQNSGTGISDNAILTGTQFGSDYFDQEYISGGTRTVDQNGQGTTTTAWRYFSLSYYSSSNYTGFISPQLYSATGGFSGVVAANPIASVTPLYFGWSGDAAGLSGKWTQFNWLRVRAYPPNGVMPSVTFGSVQTTSLNITVSLNGHDDTNMTLLQNKTLSIKVTDQNTTQAMDLYYNGNLVESDFTSTFTYTVKNVTPGLNTVKVTTSSSASLYYVLAGYPISGYGKATYTNTLSGSNIYHYILSVSKSQNYTGFTSGTYNQTIKPYDTTNSLFFNGFKDQNKSFVYGTAINITGVNTNVTAHIRQNGSDISDPQIKILGHSLYEITVYNYGNDNYTGFNSTFDGIKSANVTYYLNITKYPYVNATLSLPQEPSSWNEPLEFVCSYTTNLTSVVPIVSNGQIISGTSTAYTNTTPSSFSLPYNSSINRYGAFNQFNVSHFSSYCTAHDTNFSSATSATIKYNLTLQKLANYTISRSILSGSNISSGIEVVTDTPYKKPAFECNGTYYAVSPVGLSLFSSSFKPSKAGQYDCIWQDYNNYNVQVSSYNESSVISPSISGISQKNVSDVYLSNDTLPAYYNNSITLDNLANISWTYPYTYSSGLIPTPSETYLYNGTHLMDTYSTAEIIRNITIGPHTVLSMPITYLYSNATDIKTFLKENMSYNNTFGNSSSDSIAEYSISTIYGNYLPNGTKLDIKDSCDYLSGKAGNGGIKGVACSPINLSEDYHGLIDNVSFSWIRYNGTNVSYANITLTSDILNQSLQGYRIYNITSSQNIPITAILNTTQYPVKGWNQSIRSFTLDADSNTSERIPAVGDGTKIGPYTLATVPHSLSQSFFYKAVVTVPNSTKAWIESNPSEFYALTNGFKYFYRRSNASLLIASHTIQGYVSSSITAFSIAPTTPVYESIQVSKSIMGNLTNGSTIMLSYSVDNNGLNPVTSQVSLFTNVPVSKIASYIIVGVIIITFFILLRKGILGEVIKRLQEEEKTARRKK
jgi:hypothetical protein